MKYFLHLLKKRIPIFVASFLFVFLVGFIVNMTYRGEYTHDGKTASILLVYYIILMVLCLIIPVYEFSFKMEKRTAFKIYSFPISKRNLYIIHYVLGFVEIIIPFILGSLLSIIPVIVTDNPYRMQFFYLYLLIAIVPILLSYSYSVFFFTRGNNMVDGITIMLLAVLAMPAFFLTLTTKIGIVFDLFAFPFFLLSYSYMLFEFLLENGVIIFQNSFNFLFGINYVIPFIFVLILSIAATVLFFLMIGKDKIENIGSRSDTLFGYRTLIPLIGISCSSGLIYFLLMGILTYLGYVLFTRSYKLTAKYRVVLIVVICIELTSMFIWLCNSYPNFW